MTDLSSDDLSQRMMCHHESEFAGMKINHGETMLWKF